MGLYFFSVLMDSVYYICFLISPLSYRRYQVRSSSVIYREIIIFQIFTIIFIKFTMMRSSQKNIQYVTNIPNKAFLTSFILMKFLRKVKFILATFWL